MVMNNKDLMHRQITIRLEDRDLWMRFFGKTNEMIVTRSGRNMFPVLKTSVMGLEATSIYEVVVDFHQIDNHKWKYINGEWQQGTKPDPIQLKCEYKHPDSPNFGSHWMKDSVSFNKVKLTNKPPNKGQIQLNSLHKYEPRIVIYKLNTNVREKIAETSFHETQFIAVTAYQNEEITSLKIRFNPFAKAFLDVRENKPDHNNSNEEYTSEEFNNTNIQSIMNTNLQQASSSSQLAGINDTNWPISSNTYNQQYTFPIQHSSTGVERYRSSLSSHRSAPYQSNFQAATHHHHHHHQYSSLQPPLPPPPPPMLNYSSLLENNNSNEPANRQISSSTSSSSPLNLNQFSNSTTTTTTSTNLLSPQSNISIGNTNNNTNSLLQSSSSSSLMMMMSNSSSSIDSGSTTFHDSWSNTISSLNKVNDSLLLNSTTSPLLSSSSSSSSSSTTSSPNSSPISMLNANTMPSQFFNPTTTPSNNNSSYTDTFYNNQNYSVSSSMPQYWSTSSKSSSYQHQQQQQQQQNSNQQQYQNNNYSFIAAAVAAANNSVLPQTSQFAQAAANYAANNTNLVDFKYLHPYGGSNNNQETSNLSTSPLSFTSNKSPSNYLHLHGMNIDTSLNQNDSGFECSPKGLTTDNSNNNNNNSLKLNNKHLTESSTKLTTSQETDSNSNNNKRQAWASNC